MTVGETLAQTRIDRGMSLEDVSTATRIRQGLIQRIEADDWSACGGAVYARGHIRSIARALGCDADPLIAEFDREHSTEAPPAVLPATGVDPDAAAAADRRGPNWAAAMVVALVVICVIAAVSLFSGKSKPTAGIAGGPTTPAPSTASTPDPTPAATVPPGSVAQLGNHATALIRVQTDTTWLSVETLSGRLLFQGLLNPGQRRLFKDPHGLRLTIGNAPAVSLVADGQDLGAPQSQGNVAHVTIQPRGRIEYA